MRKDVSIHEREEVFEVDGEDRPWVCEGQTGKGEIKRPILPVILHPLLWLPTHLAHRLFGHGTLGLHSPLLLYQGRYPQPCY